MADIQSAKMAKVANDLREMEAFIQEAMRSANSTLASLLHSEIRINAPVNSGKDTKEDQDALKNSFMETDHGPFHITLHSSAPHAYAQQKPTPAPHPIFPDKADGLAWVPKNSAKWEERSPGTEDPEWFFDDETNRVVVEFVDHPGVEGNRYLSNAVTTLTVHMSDPQGPVNQETIDAIEKSGFRRVG